jgi:hypothetical protein
MQKSSAEIAFDLQQGLYAQQVSRRDSIRSTLAVPLAIIGFAAFGLNGLRTSLTLSWDTEVLQILSFLALTCGAFAGFFMIWGISHARRFDYKSVVPVPEVAEFVRQEQEMVSDLKPRITDLDQIKTLSREAAWKALSEEYESRTMELESRNSQNLGVQEEMLFRLLIGLGFLVLAIMLITAASLLADYQSTQTAGLLNSQSTAATFPS